MIQLRHQQSRKIAFYSRGFAEHFFVPNAFYRRRLRAWLQIVDRYPPDAINRRVNYYNKLKSKFPIPHEALTITQIPKGKTTYFFDFRRILRHFPSQVKTFSRFGDKTDVTAVPGFVKTRPLGVANENSVLLRLNSIRHFRPIADSRPYRQKKDSLVWRGRVNRDHRKALFRQHFGNPRLDIGLTNERPVPELRLWRKPYLSIAEQLQYKFILSVEGNDVATNLKWIAQSNSLCFMTKPKFESWFMEGTLEAGKHYVALRDDYADLTEKMDYYLDNPDEAETIIGNFQNYYTEFSDQKKEHLIGLLVVKKYLELSGQLDESIYHSHRKHEF